MLLLALWGCEPDGGIGGGDGAVGDDTSLPEADTGWPDGPYSELCKHDMPSPIADATGSLVITGLEDAPVGMPVGASVDGTGGLDILACVPDLGDDAILDDLVLHVRLSLFDHDDAPLDLGVAGDAKGVQVVNGTWTDWHDVVPWDEDGTFLYFAGGSASFSEIDKDGRLVGTVEVTATDPPGYPHQLEIDLSW